MRWSSEIINTLWVYKLVLFFREICTPSFLEWGQDGISTTCWAQSCCCLFSSQAVFAQLLDQPPLWASSQEKQQKRHDWKRDRAKVVVYHLPVSCPLSRAAVFPHKKLEQLITCSAAHDTPSSCSHVPSPCSPRTVPVPVSWPAMQHVPRWSLQGKSSGAACPMPRTLERGCWPVPGQVAQAGTTHSSYITEMREILLSLLLWRRQRCLTCWFVLLGGFFPVFYPTKELGLKRSERGSLFLLINYAAESVVFDVVAVNTDKTWGALEHESCCNQFFWLVRVSIAHRVSKYLKALLQGSKKGKNKGKMSP